MKIQTNIVYAHEENPMNIGLEYNRVLEESKSDYVIFLDHDAMFTDKYWFNHIVSIIKENQDVSLFTCLTNRIGNKQQLAFYDNEEISPKSFHSHDILYHREIGAFLKEKNKNQVEDLEYYVDGDDWRALSGVLMVVKKSSWEKVKFKEGFLGVDGEFHKDLIDLGHKCVLMKGVYLYHFYRGDNKIDHLYLANSIYEPIQIKK
jgi:glycosyltransferase involved in cell wall biosynthesis